MKKYLVLLILSLVLIFIGISGVFANMGPLSKGRGSGGLEFNSGSIMAQNVSVEKHLLLFKTSKKNLYNPNAKYLGYEFLQNKLGVSKEYIYDNSINSDNFFGIVREKLINNLSFIEKEQPYYETGSVDIEVRYFLKNNSNKKINSENIAFSFGKTEHILSDFVNGVEDIYVLNDENNYPTNFNVKEGKNKLQVNENFVIQKFKQYYSGYDIEKYATLNSINKIASFNLSFNPNETKIITITYSLPLKFNHNGTKYIDYDYTPIFNWKDGIVKKSYIAVIGDDENILYGGETYIDKYINKKYEELQYIFFEKLKKNIYGVYLKNVDKNKNINNLEIAFSNLKEINQGSCGYGRINSSFLCVSVPNNDGLNYYGEMIKIFPSTNSQKAIIKELKNTIDDKNPEYSGKEYEIDIFDILK